MRTEGSIEIDRPIEEVFQVTTERVAEWSLIVVEDEVIEDLGGVGTTFRTVTEDRGKRMEFDGEITKHDPPRAHSMKMVGASFEIEADYLFEDLGGRTKVTQVSVVTGKGFFKVMLCCMGGLMKKSSCEALDKELQGLKDLCEG